MKFFGSGWGDQSVLKALTEFSHTMKDANACMGPVSKHFDEKRMTIVEDKNSKYFRTYTGSFTSPMNDLFPDLLPVESQTCHFKMILPKKWDDEAKKRICLLYAPTGDHGYGRREFQIAKPLAKEYNIGSVIVENPFYGSRKPKNQVRSCTRHVTDVLSMGCSLMLEGQFLFHWLESNGYGPLGISGVSLGGHNASLTAAVWQKPIAIIPCLSWSSAAHCFSEGLLCGTCVWEELREQLETDKLQHIHHAINKTDAEIQDILAERLSMKKTEENRVKMDSKINKSMQSLLDTLTWVPSLPNSLIPDSFGAITARYSGQSEKSDHSKEAAELYMRLVFDTFTNLKLYPRPVPASLNSTVIVVAKDDLYIPQPVDRDIRAFSEVWPGCDLKVVKGGHISTYLFDQKGFRAAIKLAFDKLDINLAEEDLRDAIMANNLDVLDELETANRIDLEILLRI